MSDLSPEEIKEMQDSIDRYCRLNGGKTMTAEPKRIEPYTGCDMASYILQRGLTLQLDPMEYILSITNRRDKAVIVTNYTIWLAVPSWGLGFHLERRIML